MQILRGENGRILAKRKKNTTRGIGYIRIEPLTGGAARLAVKSASNADATDKVTDGRRRIRPVAETGQRGAKPPMPEL